MKLTEEQLLILKDTLGSRITYRETYEEVYDHILEALENTADNVSLTVALDIILQNDFGGVKGIKALERKRRWMVARQMVSKQLQYIVRNFKFPLLPFTVIIYACLYVITTNVKFYGFEVFLFIALVPNIFKAARYFTIGYKYGSTQRSIKDLPFKVMGNVPFYLFFCSALVIQWGSVYFFNHPAKLNLFNLLEFSPLVLSSFFCIYIIYNLSFFRLYRDEFDRLKVQ